MLVLVYGTLYAQVSITLPLAIKDAGLRNSDFGYVIAVNGILIVFGQPLTLGIMTRVSRRYTLPAGIFGVALGLAGFGLCHQPWQFGLSVALLTAGEIFTAGSFQSIIASLAPAHMRGRYGGALGLAWGASGLLAPLVGASVFAASPGALWIGCLLVGTATAAGQGWLIGAIDRRQASQAIRQRPQPR